MTPIPFDNVIYSVHVYQPMGFTHQGIGQKKDAYLHHSYPTTQAKLDENRKRYPGDLGKDSGKVEAWDKEYVRREIRTVREFQLKYGARIYIGEFSAIRFAPGACQYLADLTSIFEEYGWDWSYHAFREWFNWSVEYDGDIHNEKPATSDTDRKRLLLELFRKNVRRTY